MVSVCEYTDYGGFKVPVTTDAAFAKAVDQFNAGFSCLCIGTSTRCRVRNPYDESLERLLCEDCIFSYNVGPSKRTEKCNAFADYARDRGYKISRAGFARSPSANLTATVINVED